MTEELRRFARNFQWDRIGAMLPPPGTEHEKTWIDNFSTDLLQSSMLCVFKADAALQARRDAFGTQLPNSTVKHFSAVI